MGIHLELSRFDGKSVALLEELAESFPPDEELLGHLVDICSDPDKDMQTGATWLIRRHLEDGRWLTAEQTGRLLEALPEMHDGFGRLHLCQAASHLELDAKGAERFFAFLRECRESGNTFLRAWAPDAMWKVSERHPEHRPEAQSAVEAALNDAAASVRARARKTLQGG